MSATNWANPYRVTGGAAQDIDDGLKELQDSLMATNLTPREPNYFEWPGASQITNSVKIPCIPSMTENGIVLNIGGVDRTIVQSLNVSKSYFITGDLTVNIEDLPDILGDNNTPTPTPGRRLIFRGVPYFILTAGVDPCNAFYHITLASVNK